MGFAVGFERVALALEAQGVELGADEEPCVYVANAGDELRGEVFALCCELRSAGVRTEANYQGRSLKSQFKQADKLGARIIVVVGGDELAEGKVRVRDMRTHDEELVAREAVRDAVAARL